MDQRDYLMRQIEQMTQALVTLIRRLLGLGDNTEEVKQATDEVFTTLLSVPLQKLMDLTSDDLLELVEEKEGMEERNLELLSEILVLNARACKDEQEYRNLLEKALALLDRINTRSKTFSLERQQKISEIQASLTN